MPNTSAFSGPTGAASPKIPEIRVVLPAASAISAVNNAT